MFSNLFSLLSYEKIKVSNGNSFIPNARADAQSEACSGGIEAVLRTPQRLETINKCLREAYVLARGVLRVCGTTRMG